MISINSVTKAANDALNFATKKDFESLIDESNLTDIQAEIIIMRFGKGKSIDYIADTMCVSRGTVNRHLKAARKKIGKLL